MNPAPASLLITLLFIVLVVAVFVLFAKAAHRALGSQGGVWWRPVVLVLVVAVIVPGVLAASGKLDRYNPLPAPALFVIAVTTVLTIVLATGRVGLAFAANLPLASLIWFQLFRVPVELCLHQLYVQGVVPQEMTYAGRNFDIISGIGAAIVGFIVARGNSSRALVWLWNVIGLGLLLNIVVVAVLCTPVPFRAFTSGPPNLLPSTFPFVWLPTVLVQAALFGHIVVFKALIRKRES